MTAPTIRNSAATVVLGLALGLSAAACTSHGTSAPGAAAAASSAFANPVVSADVAGAEAIFTANFQKDFSAAHPVTSVKKAVTDTFPSGNTAAIEQYAVSSFKVSMVHDKTARQAWLQDVAAYALHQGGASAAPSARMTLTPAPGGSPVPASPSYAASAS